MGSKILKIGAEANTSVSGRMPSFVSQIPITNSNGTEGNTGHSLRVSDFRAPEQSLVFRGGGASNTNRMHNSTTMFNPTLHPDLQFGDFEKMLQIQKGSQANQVSNSGGNRENRLESNMGDASLTDTSAEMDADDKNQRFEDPSNPLLASSSTDKPREKSSEQKTLRRLAQNREAARKSRLRKKAYVQQLENSRLKLTQLEQEVQRARKQGVPISSSSDQSQPNGGNGALAFDVEYSRWLEEESRHINELRTAVSSHASDGDLRSMVENAVSHYDEIFRLKGTAAKADVFHIIYGMWQTPAERCFLWIGGFRSSELLKLLVNHLEPLTEQQLASIDNLQQSSLQAEEALSQGMDALQQSLAETLAGSTPAAPGNMANYMGQMAMAMGKLGTLEGFLHQADNLRQQTLQQMHRILTTRQSARALLAINDYFSRLRALSSLWLARPQE